MDLERGTIGRLPYAALGTGDPVLVIGGLFPFTGPGSDRIARVMMIGSLAGLADRRRLVCVNRRAGLPRGMTMADMAAEHAEAIRDGLGAPVDVLGTSTGGSIAQQLAADHPDVVRRLVLLSTACRLGAEGKRMQRQVAARFRRGAYRQAIALLAAEIVPRGRLAAGILASLIGPLVLRDKQGLDDMATTIEAEDSFDLATLAPIRVRTLIFCGRDDQFYTPELFEETARLIPDSDLRMLDGRGHASALSDRRQREAVAAFL
jgi:pimeloyl-ACP methyl ester carboxylesterase